MAILVVWCVAFGEFNGIGAIGAMGAIGTFHAFGVLRHVIQAVRPYITNSHLLLSAGCSSPG